MSTVVIDIYGCGIRIGDKEQIIVDSDSCALIESSNNIIVGSDAVQQAHLQPRDINLNYWDKLSVDSGTRHAISNAEIAYTHLKQVWEQANISDRDVVISVANTFTKQDLGLLLGITEKLAIPVRGIMCNAILAQSGPLHNCKVVFLDLRQSSLIVSEIVQNKKEISVGPPIKIFRFGLQSLLIAVAEFISKQFISETRYDPMHLAQDEQQLFNKLPEWLSEIQSSEIIECELGTDAKKHRIQLSRKSLQEVNESLYARMSSYLSMEYSHEASLTIMCSASCTKIYGVVEYLQKLPGCAVTVLNKNSLINQALLQLDQIQTKNEQVHYITSLEWNKTSAPVSVNYNPGNLSELSLIPTHALINNQAYLISEETYLIKNSHANTLTIKTIYSKYATCKITKKGFLVEIEPLSNDSLTLNNESLHTSRAVQIGDLVNVKGFSNQLDFIKVSSDET